MKVIKLLLPILFFQIGFSQVVYNEPTNVQVLSPEVSTLRKYSETPVSHYTGVPQINIPLYTIKVKDFELPIRLNYHAGGIRVNESAGWVGLGWSLGNIPVISRSVKGLYDERHYMTRFPVYQSSNSEKYGTIDHYLTLAGISETGTSQSKETDALLTSHLDDIEHGTTNAIDFMPDEFYINIPGYSGKAMYSQNKEKFILVPMADIKIEKAVPGNWQLVDNLGYTYVFGLGNALESNNGDVLTPVPYRGINAWKISKIITPDGEVIEFKYINVSHKRENRLPQTYSRFIEGGNQSFPVYPSRNGYQYSINQESVSILQSIEFPAGKILFDINGTREDLTKLRKLNGVRILNKNNDIVKEYDLKYGYFTSKEGPFKASDENPAKRLRLEELIDIYPYNSNKSLSYKFKYYEDMDLPNRISSNSQDYWGYYNGKDNRTLIPYVEGMPRTDWMADRTVSEKYFKAYLLKSIKYPEGGRTEYRYERNTSKTRLVGSQRIHDLMPLLPNYNNRDLYINEKNEPIIDLARKETLNVSGFFNKDQPNGVYWGFPSPTEVKLPYTFIFRKDYEIKNFDKTNKEIYITFNTNFPKDYISPAGLDAYYKLYYQDEKGNYKAIIQEGRLQNKFPLRILDSQLVNGTAKLRFEIVKVCANGTGDIGKPNLPFSTSINFEWINTAAESLYDDIYAGGARIKDIRTFKNSEDPVYIGRKNFKYELEDGSTSGLIFSVPVHKSRVIGKFPDPNYNPDQSHSQGESCPVLTSTGFQVRSDNFIPSINTNGSTVGYTKVIEEQLGRTDSYIGKIEHNFSYRESFTDDENFVRSYDPYEGLHFGLMQNMDWKNGNLLSTVYYDEKNSVLKRIDYEYDYNYFASNYLDDNIIEGINTNYLGSCKFDLVEEVCRGPYLINFFYINVREINDLQSRHSCRTYLKVTNARRKKPYYTRKTGVALLKSTKTTDFYDNNTFEQHSEYFYDRNHLRPIRNVVSMSREDKVIETRTYYPEDIFTFNYATLGISESEFVNVLQLKKYNKHRLAEPILTQNTVKEGNRSISRTSNLVVYDKTDSDLVKPSAYKSIKGLGIFQDNIQDDVTIHKYDNFGKPLEISLNEGLHTIYVYGYNNQFLIAKIDNKSYENLLPAQKNAIDKVKSISDQDVTAIHENTLISELEVLRDNFPDSMVYTYTHKPLVGVTSQTDPRGYTIFYHYDGFNRLDKVTDANGYIVSENLYNYKN